MGRKKLSPEVLLQRASVGQLLRSARKSKELTPTELAARAGISYAYLQNIEAGRRRLTPEVAERISQALGVEVAA